MPWGSDSDRSRRDHVVDAVAAEELLLRVVPAFRDRGDGEQIYRRQPIRMLSQDLRLQRTVAVLSRGLLRGVGVEVFKVGLGVGRDALVFEVRIDPGDSRLGEDTDWRINDFEFVLVLRDFP